MNDIETLEESIKFATSELKYFEDRNDLSDTTNMVVGSLFRKIVEHSSGVKVCALNGLMGPTDLNYRGLIECYLAYKYLTLDREKLSDRAKAYKIGYHKLQIESVELNKESLLAKYDINSLNEVIHHHRKEIEREEFKDVLKEYNRVHKRDKKGHLPKWYSLKNGPKSINQLANVVEKNIREEEKKVVAALYGQLSSAAHNLLAIRDIKMNTKGETYLNPIQFSFKPENATGYNIQATRSLLTSSILSFTLDFCPEYTEQFKEFAVNIKENLAEK